jgi:hypothetical protein
VRKPLVRFARRLASWESSVSDDDLLDTEFKTRDTGVPDLRPSVYEIGPDEVVQAFAEHATAFDPPSNAGGIDLHSSGRTIVPTIGDTGFAFTMDAHREIVLSDRADLHALVREARSSLPQRTYRVAKAAICQYARERIASGDPEWTNARGAAGAKGWLTKIPI